MEHYMNETKHDMNQTFRRKFTKMQKKQNRICSLACQYVINRRSVSSICVHSDNCTCPGNIQFKWRLSCETYSECQGQRILRRSNDILPTRISNIYGHNLQYYNKGKSQATKEYAVQVSFEIMSHLITYAFNHR